MKRSDLEAFAAIVTEKADTRQRLGSYDANAGPIIELYEIAIRVIRHLIEVDKDISKLKRQGIKKKK